ncbi:MAG TPA: hypothetical protein VMI12_03930 [Puia sp.]|nr:hypothetical protein [Puia sp.]
MKISTFIFIIIAFVVCLAACQQQPSSDIKQETIDSLKTTINHLKPGLGEFMLQIKYHHDELSKAITEKSYERVSYEIDELNETFGKIQQLHISNDKLQQPFPFFYDKYMKSVLEVLSGAAAKKDDAVLKTNMTALTNNCNSCHHENNMSFMKIN